MESPQERLALLREYLGNDTRQVKEMVELFLEKIPEDLHELKMLNRQKEYEKLGHTAHRIKSSVKLFGMHKVAAILQKLETSEKQNLNSGERDSLVRQVAEHMEKELKNLQQQLETLP